MKFYVALTEKGLTLNGKPLKKLRVKSSTRSIYTDGKYVIKIDRYCSDLKDSQSYREYKKYKKLSAECLKYVAEVFHFGKIKILEGEVMYFSIQKFIKKNQRMKPLKKHFNFMEDFCRQHKIGDFHSDNFILNERGTPVLVDLGLSYY